MARLDLSVQKWSVISPPMPNKSVRIKMRTFESITERRGAQRGQIESERTRKKPVEPECG